MQGQGVVQGAGTGASALGAGASGLGSSLPAGLQGLFAALISAGEGDAATFTSSDGEQVLSQLTDLFGAEDTQSLLDTFAALDSSEGSSVLGAVSDLLASLDKLSAHSDTVQVEQTTVSIETLTVQLQHIVVSLEEAGIDPQVMGDVDEFAAALHEQGMPLEDAIEASQRITEAMNAVRKQLGLPEIETGDDSGLASFINAAVSTTSLTQVQTEVTWSHTEIEVVTAESSVGLSRDQQIALFAAQKTNAPVADIAQRALSDAPLIPNSAPSSPSVQPSEKQTTDIVEPLLAGADGDVSQEVVDAEDQELQETLARDTVVFDAAAGEDVSDDAVVLNQRQPIGASDKHVVNDVRPASPAAGDAVASSSVEEEGLPNNTIQGTEAPKPIEGTTIYKWQSTSTGMDVMTQSQQQAMMADTGDMPVEMDPDALDAEMSVSEKADASRSAAFSERMATFTRHAQLGSQVAPAMKTLTEQGGGTVRVTLNPAELGEVDIELHIKDGQVHGKIASQNPEVIEGLARELQHLKQGLSDAGYQLGEEGISFMLQDQGQGQTGDQQQGDDGSLLAAEEELEDDLESDALSSSAQWVSPDQLLDVRV